MFQLAGLSIDEEQDPLGVCLQELSCTCNGLVQSMDLQNLEQMEVSGCREPKDEEEHQNFLNFHLESNQLEDFPEITSIPSVVNYNSGVHYTLHFINLFHCLRELAYTHTHTYIYYVVW